jgi:matrixin
VLLVALATLAVACQPLDGSKSSRIARGPHSITEFFPDGAYRVTRCDADGHPQRALTMARIATPTAAQPYVPVEEETPSATVFLLYGDPADPLWANAWLKDGGESTRAALAPDAPVPADLDRRATRAAPRDDSCTNGAFTVLKRLANPRYGYTVAGRTMSLAFRRAIVRGHHAWDDTRNSCGYTDQDNVFSSYRGTTGGSIHTVADGRSVVDFGRLDALCGSAATLACTWTFNNPITETDQRYNRAFRWSTTRRQGYYDVESAAAHETGHTIGLGHAGTSPFLTMYQQICAGCTRGRTLGRGDVRGMRALY